MKARIKVKFPCGYEYLFEYKRWGAYTSEPPKAPTECPLHGKKCRKGREEE